MAFADKYLLSKNKKSNMFGFLSYHVFNHPNRLASVSLSGSMSLTRDSRDWGFPYSTTSGTVKEYSVNFALAPTYTRTYFEKEPTPHYPPFSSVPGGFILGHKPNKWSIIQSGFEQPSAEVVGTKTTTNYSRPSESDPWVAGAVTTQDITLSFNLGIGGGGDPFSGGKGDGGDEEKAGIYFHPLWNIYTELPDFGAYNNEIKRLPWDSSWASESSLFSTIFSDYLSENNEAFGNGFSGTCSLALNFNHPT